MLTKAQARWKFKETCLHALDKCQDLILENVVTSRNGNVLKLEAHQIVIVYDPYQDDPGIRARLFVRNLKTNKVIAIRTFYEEGTPGFPEDRDSIYFMDYRNVQPLLDSMPRMEELVRQHLPREFW